jgi:AbrB family looped-hinge helix DNA binding protein
MEIVRLKDRGQITLPAAIREELNAQLGDFFAMTVEDGAIVMKPQALAARLQPSEAPRKKQAPSSWFGSVKGVYASAEEIDAYITAERAQWD